MTIWENTSGQIIEEGGAVVDCETCPCEEGPSCDKCSTHSDNITLSVSGAEDENLGAICDVPGGADFIRYYSAMNGDWLLPYDPPALSPSTCRWRDTFNGTINGIGYTLTITVQFDAFEVEVSIDGVPVTPNDNTTSDECDLITVGGQTSVTFPLDCTAADFASGTIFQGSPGGAPDPTPNWSVSGASS